MLEKRFYAVPPQLFTSNGTTAGVVMIAGEACQLFKVGMKVYINATGLPTLYLQVKEIDSEDNVQVGPIPGSLKVPGANTGIDARTNISAYTVGLNASISADEQKRPPIDYAEIMRAVYDEEPSVALRTIMVDECGDRINADNPFPVAFDGTVQIGDVSIVEGGNTMEVNDDGSINVNIVNSTPTSTPGLTFLTNEITSVPSSSETTIITVTAPTDGYRVQKIELSGDTVALYRVYVNGGSPILYKRSWWGDFNLTFDFESFTNGLLLTSGQVLTITCYQTSPFLGTFEATVITLIN